MQSPLTGYRRKRDFAATPEPRPKVERRRAARIYVIQRHEARRLHYDFRLELDGVLQSWAVPKGPSEQVGVRRLAVHVEDHPLAYAQFEGDIPKGQYGGGHVDIWDHGTWTPVGDPRTGLREGHLKFDLAGGRLRGRYALIRMKSRDGERAENWLLIREREQAASAPTKEAPSARRRASGIEDRTARSRAGAATSGSDRKPAAKRRGASAAAVKTVARKAAGVAHATRQTIAHAAGRAAMATAAGARTTRTRSPKSTPTDNETRVEGIAISHATREIPQTGGLTKLDVVRYHQQMESWLLPQIASRPLAVIKCPGGDFRHCFFQKHAGAQRGKRPDPLDPPYLRIATLPDVISAVQGGTLEFHSWGASFPRVDRPDRITLDLDPDPGVTWDNFLDAAQSVRDLLTRLELHWFIKTTGGKGVHFVVPLMRRHTWDEVKAVAAAMAQHLAQARPALFVALASKSKRPGKVFVDYLRNAEGATAVAAYSLRARSDLPVSMPITWEDLRDDVRGSYFNLRNAPELVATRAKDPWADYEASRQRLRGSLLKAIANGK